MKISGIVCEYNPFHNGHKYHIEETRKNGATHIIAVMSGNFVQRGDLAVADKFTRAEAAVNCGADLVIELPVQYSIAPAELFARGAVHLLHSLGVVDELSFGSECGDVRELISAAEALDKIANSPKIRELTEQGSTYARAVSAVLEELYPEAAEVISQPNNVLGVEYIKAIRLFSSDISPFTVKRAGAGHDSDDTCESFASASYIRANMAESAEFLPEISSEIISGDTADIKRLERAILYRLRTASLEEIRNTADCADGLAERIYSAKNAVSLDEFFESVKTKRFTMARIRRIVLSLLIGITKEDMKKLPSYGRIIALNSRGREILSLAKGKSLIPFGTSLAKLSQNDMVSGRFAVLESVASDVYGLAFENIVPTQREFTAKIKIQE
ncbi:MAG: nucleotidyltransferase family protein [Ruminococcus sp.]|nr:nucleotidyltransferase family protein [Ruminococcus sp.]